MSEDAYIRTERIRSAVVGRVYFKAYVATGDHWRVLKDPRGRSKRFQSLDVALDAARRVLAKQWSAP